MSKLFRARSQGGARNSKKVRYIHSKRTEVKFNFILEHRTQFSIGAMCKVLTVSRSGFYAWSIRKESLRKLDDKRILELIKDVFKSSRDTYGYRRILAALRDMNEICSKHKILRLIRENNIRPKTRRKFKVTTNFTALKTKYKSQ